MWPLEFKDGDRVTDLLFPENGPCTLRQHPDPQSASGFRNNLDKWLLVPDDKSRPTYWIAKKGDHAQINRRISRIQIC